jgi:hypothetical protein
MTAKAPLVVIRGEATDDEVAAVVTVLQAVATAARTSAEPAPPRSTWADPARMHRTAHHAGPGGWRASALPR